VLPCGGFCAFHRILPTGRGSRTINRKYGRFSCGLRVGHVRRTLRILGTINDYGLRRSSGCFASRSHPHCPYRYSVRNKSSRVIACLDLRVIRIAEWNNSSGSSDREAISNPPSHGGSSLRSCIGIRLALAPRIIALSRRIGLVEWIVADIGINSSPRHDCVVPAAVFPRRVSGLKSERG
jgi:hypothetical protein